MPRRKSQAPDGPARGRLVWADPASFKPHPMNPNTGHDVPAIVRSIQANGWGRVPVCARDMTLLAGHGTRLAAIELGQDMPCMVRDDLAPDDPEALALLVADNETARRSRAVPKRMAEIVGRLHEQARGQLAALEGTGLRSDEVQRLLGLAKRDPHGADPGPLPSDREADPQSALGEVYELGPHRLVCGDATDPTVWDALLGDRLADGLLTDPPYGVAHRSQRIAGAPGREIANDGDLDDAMRVLRAAVEQAVRRCVEGAAGLVFTASGQRGKASTPGRANVLGRTYDVLSEVTVGVDEVLTWDKGDCGGAGWRWRRSTEFVLECLLSGSRFRTWHGRYGTSNILRHGKRSGARNKGSNHPTPKPVPLLVDLIDLCFPQGGIVLDPFAGSGSTMIAAAKTGRQAWMIEIDPHYCDLIRRRWQRFTESK